MKTDKLLTVSKLLEKVDSFVVNCQNLSDLPIENVVYDSRKVGSGDCFVAIEGTSSDGNQYVINALEAGAKVVLFSNLSIVSDFIGKFTETVFVQFKTGYDYQVLARVAESFYGNPADDLRLIGVTGTNGKTTTCYLINHILRSSGVKTALIGTVAYDIDGVVTDATHTTPDPLQLQKIFRQAVDSGVEAVVMEISSHAASQNRTGSALFEALAFTNLTGEHLDYHKSMENYFEAKRSIFVESLATNGKTVINCDDSWGEKLASEFSGEIYGFENGISEYKIVDNGSQFLLDGSMKIEIPLYGRFNIANTAAAVKVALAYGIEFEQIAESLVKFRGVPGRLESVRLKNGALGFVDYAHTDDALLNVGQAVSELPHQRIITVFGCGGDRDRTKRPRMANAVEQFSDLIIVTADNSRNESVEQIFSDIEKGFSKTSKYEVVPERDKAIARAVEISSSGDIILVAGKGHENYQIEQGVTRHFSDLEELQTFV